MLRAARVAVISIHALREESDAKMVPLQAAQKISIHALREESDGDGSEPYMTTFWISIHALREESDQEQLTEFLTKYKFQSTPSARRATPMTSCRSS